MKLKIVASMMAFLMVGNSLSGFTAQTSESQKNDTSNVYESTSLLSESILRQDGDSLRESYDAGRTWKRFSASEIPASYSYDEFLAWMTEEIKSLQEFVAVGEITQEKADTIINQYYETLGEIEKGVQVSKRNSYSEDQIVFGAPDAMHTEGFQKAVYDGKSYQYFGPYETKAELYSVLKQYTDKQIASGNMTQGEADEILKEYR